VFDQLGWTETIFNHITLRVPGPQRVLLINPYGLMYHEVTASNLVAVDIDGPPFGLPNTQSTAPALLHTAPSTATCRRRTA
jgi:ribulose-5-phosphate 4-epimerase/fuculose-1-phosphate aldolase